MLKIIKDIELKTLLEAKEELMIKMKSQNKLREEAENGLNKMALKMQKMKDKIVPVMEKYETTWRKDGTLTEFDQMTTVKLENGDIVVEVLDLVENYKKTLRDKYAKSTKNVVDSSKGAK